MLHSASDLQYIKDRYAKASSPYKPRHISTLLIVDAPPDALDRYFYFEEVKKQDSLFLEIMGMLYPEQKQQYLASGREPVLKSEMLETFKEDGYFLINLSEVPCSLLEHPLERDITSLLQRLPTLVDKTTPILLIKANVYDICYEPLAALGYQVINERLPFPGSGQQRVFRERFRKALAS